MTPSGTDRVLDVTGEQIDITGELSLPIAISDVPVWTSRVVTDKSPTPVILGRPFMRQTNATLNFRQGTLQFNDDVVIVRMKSLDQEFRCFNEARPHLPGGS